MAFLTRSDRLQFRLQNTVYTARMHVVPDKLPVMITANYFFHMRSEVLRATNIKFLWNAALLSLVDKYQRFGGICYLHFLCRSDRFKTDVADS